MDTFTVNIRKLFGFHNNHLYNDRSRRISNIESHRTTRDTKSDWYEQIHGVNDDSVGKQKGAGQ